MSAEWKTLLTSAYRAGPRDSHHEKQFVMRRQVAGTLPVLVTGGSVYRIQIGGDVWIAYYESIDPVGRTVHMECKNTTDNSQNWEWVADVLTELIKDGCDYDPDYDNPFEFIKLVFPNRNTPTPEGASDGREDQGT